VTGWDALAFMGMCTRAQALTAVECDYVELAAVTAVHTAGIRAELTRRRNVRVAKLMRAPRFVSVEEAHAILAGAR
jgi:hypothetical protein